MESRSGRDFGSAKRARRGRRAREQLQASDQALFFSRREPVRRVTQRRRTAPKTCFYQTLLTAGDGEDGTAAFGTVVAPVDLKDSERAGPRRLVPIVQSCID